MGAIAFSTDGNTSATAQIQLQYAAYGVVPLMYNSRKNEGACGWQTGHRPVGRVEKGLQGHEEGLNTRNVILTGRMFCDHRNLLYLGLTLARLKF